MPGDLSYQGQTAATQDNGSGIQFPNSFSGGLFWAQCGTCLIHC
jgi:hypothetical protein